MNTQEIWRDVCGYEGIYQVSNLGRVKRENRILTLTLRNNYMYAHLSLHCKQKQVRVHRLVAEAFLPYETGKPCVNHIDGNTLNNCVWNLEWCTYSENRIHALSHNLADYGENSSNAKLRNEDVYEIRILLENGMKQKDIASIYNVHPSVISNIKTNKKWKYII